MPSRLYIDTTTDMISTDRTARAKNWIKIKLYYNQENLNEAITLFCTPIDGKQGMECKVYSQSREVGELVVQNPEDVRFLSKSTFKKR